jgi:hypothetical protein
MGTQNLPTNLPDWWNHNRLKYNKGLAVAGLISIVITALAFYLFDNSIQEGLSVLIIAVPVYILYMAALNFIFLVSEFFDRRYNSNIDNNSRDFIFRYFYWFSLALPFLYPVFIISMFCIY